MAKRWVAGLVIAIVLGAGCSSSQNAGGTSAGTGCAAYAEQLCALMSRCSTAYEDAFHGPPVCRTDLAALCEWRRTLSGTGYTDAAITACAQQYASASCDALLDDLGGPCRFRGTLPGGAPCVDSDQCQSLDCTTTAPGATCGTCAPVIAPGTACAETTECDPEQACASGSCAPARHAGESCDAAHPCLYRYACRSGTCQHGTGAPGDPCSSDLDCDPLLSFCGAGQCQPLTGAANLGDPCPGNTSCLGDATCTGGPDPVCVARPGEGESCVGTGGGPLECAPPAVCVSGTCAVPDPAVCGTP